MKSVAITVAQQIVQRTIPALERRLDEAIGGKPQIIDFMVSSLQIVDSTGLNWMLSIQSRLEALGIRMRLVDPSPILCDVLLATRLDARFTVAMTGITGGANGEDGRAVGGSHGR